MKIFISYCKEDGKEFAEKLERDLKDQNVTLWIDKKNLKNSEQWLKQIDDQLSDSDYVIGIITTKYLNSTGGVEAYSTIAKDVKSENKKFLPCFFIPPEDSSYIISSLQGFNFSNDYTEELQKLLKHLKNTNKEGAKTILSKIEDPNSNNPFRRVRTEFYYENYDLLAKNFAEPEKEKYDMIMEAKPIYLIGGRGSGKTMILKSLLPEVLISKLEKKNFSEIKEVGINFFGLYFKLKKGSSLIYDYHQIVEMGYMKTNLAKDYNTYISLFDKLKNDEVKNDPVLTAGVNAAWIISLNELNLKILKNFITELLRLRNNNFINFDVQTEQNVVKRISYSLGIDKLEISENNFLFIIDFINKELDKIKSYVQKLAIPFAQPINNWLHTDQEFLDGVFKVFGEEISELKDVHIYLLFDEYENLRYFQQSIINEWIKTSEYFTIKFASKYDGMYTNLTLQNQPIQDGQDYWSWELDYNLFDNNSLKAYQNLLQRLCANLLKNENFKETDIKNILSESKEKELSQSVIDDEIKKIRQNANLDFNPNKIENYRNKLEISAIHRLLRKNEKVESRISKHKSYSGFDTFTYLSSGIIRIFLNLAGMSLYKAESEAKNIKSGEKISIEDQTWAVYTVSKAWLEKIPLNLEEYGDIMYQFIVDMGDIFRERLLNNPTEPETIAFSIEDSHKLNSQYQLNRMLSRAVSESILYEKKESSSMKPKSSNSSKAKELFLNRVYCPYLEISYRTRWPRGCKITVDELVRLVDANQRQETRKLIQKRQFKEVNNEGTLFE